MKLYQLVAGVCLLALASLASCGSAGSSNENCLIYGEVPSLYADYQTQYDKIKESAQKSESDYKKASARLEELKDEYRAKIEEAGKKLDGKPIEINPGEDFNVVTPLSFSFKEFGNSINAVFVVNGEVTAAKDVVIEVSESWLKQHNVEYLYLPLLIVGCDAQGAEVTKDRIGCFKGFTVVDNKVVLPSGTKAELQTTAYNKNKFDDYKKVASVKLALDTSKM